ncbi:MAG: Exodeoxyribonuclease 7 large subunit, partial [Planctomycetota bacterium]
MRDARVSTPVTTDDASKPVATPAAHRIPEVSVSAFNELVARTLEDSMRGQFRVVGEIANLSRKGHWYFSIKDARAVLPCVMWQSDAARVAFTPKEGDAVVVTGKIGHYAPQGKTQLYATKIEPQGVGALEIEFQRLVKELREKGYFAEERKKPLPPNPRRVAVVTSASGAALQDVLKTARERRAGVEFLVIDVRVQGDGAAAEVARALRAIDRCAASLAIDAVIVTRGGGSREDLCAFNDRAVADAAYALRIPLVAAIGHEIDTSIIELVADRRASTPTQAVMHLLPDTAALIERVDRAARDLRNATRWALQSRREATARLARLHEQTSPALRIARTRALIERTSVQLRTAISNRVRFSQRAVDMLGSRLAAQAPAARAAAARAAIAVLGPRLERAVRTRLHAERLSLVNLEKRLRSAGPEETLARGYSIVTTSAGALVRSTRDVRVGDRLSIVVSDGVFGARVETSVESVQSGGSELTHSSSTTDR